MLIIDLCPSGSPGLYWYNLTKRQNSVCLFLFTFIHPCDRGFLPPLSFCTSEQYSRHEGAKGNTQKWKQKVKRISLRQFQSRNEHLTIYGAGCLAKVNTKHAALGEPSKSAAWNVEERNSWWVLRWSKGWSSGRLWHCHVFLMAVQYFAVISYSICLLVPLPKAVMPLQSRLFPAKLKWYRYSVKNGEAAACTQVGFSFSFFAVFLTLVWKQIAHLVFSSSVIL